MMTTTIAPSPAAAAPGARDDLAVSGHEEMDPAVAPGFPEHPEVHRWSVEEYDRMVELGALSQDLRVELIDGLIVDKMPNNPPHAGTVFKLNRLFMRLEGERWLARCQLPVRLPQQRSEPEPDVALVKPRADFYTTGHPTTTDTILLVEVADSSLKIDRNAKLALYARAGIAEYWIINVPNAVVEIYRDPDPDAGCYRTSLTARPGETCAPAAFPDATIAVGDFLG